MSVRWTDLLDPSPNELAAALPSGFDPDLLPLLTAAADDLHPRPTFEGHGAYVVGHLFDALPVPGERVVYRPVSVVATPQLLVTIRTTPPAGEAWQPAVLEAAMHASTSAGELVYRLVDDVVESFFDVVDACDDEIEELEEHIDDWSHERVRHRLIDLRHEIHRARRAASATRAAIRRVLDNRLDVGIDALFPEQLERRFSEPYDAITRAAEELDGSRDVLAALRDHHQARIAEGQNDVVRKLTVISSIILVPTLIVGFYGQNFGSAFREPYWTVGVSTALIVVTTLVQLVLYRWREWI